MLATLSFAFWMSFSEIASSVIVDAKTWPLLWLGFVALIFLNPLPIMCRSTRMWLLKHTGKLLISGMHKVHVGDVMSENFTILIILYNLQTSLPNSGWGLYLASWPSHTLLISESSDQFCSLIFTLSNMYFVVCAYASGDFDNSLQTCLPSNQNWAAFFILAALPLFIRVIQSVKRYSEAKLTSHLINVSFIFLPLLHWR